MIKSLDGFTTPSFRWVSWFLLPSVLFSSAVCRADLRRDYDTLMDFARRNVQHEREQKKMEGIDDDIYNAILEYYYGQNDTTVEEELLQLPSDGDQ
tara:strand:- start:457 stop:744 length:288 start_codon:yes stop_codon:yes gene_type:complete